MQASIGGRATRTIAVLALALGVLAMHGLAGGHHGAAAGPTAMVDAAADHATGQAHAAQHAEHELLADGAAAVASLHVDGVVCDGDCSEHPSGLLLLCIAILIAAGGALALGLASRTWRSAPKTGPPPSAHACKPAPVRRVDLLADLCISRT